MRIRRRGRHENITLASEPQNQRRDQHERARNAKSHRSAELPQKYRHEQRGKERTEVDYPVERIENDLRPMLVRLVKLIADKRGDARFDAARPKRDQTARGKDAPNSRPGSTRRSCDTSRKNGPPASLRATEKSKRRSQSCGTHPSPRQDARIQANTATAT